MKPTKRIAWLDGDVLLYWAARAVQEEDWEGDGYVADPNAAYYEFNRYVDKWMAPFEGYTCKLVLSDTTNWRKTFCSTYKSNRKESDKPICLHDLRAMVVEKLEPVVKPTLEADDVIGIGVTRIGGVGVSIDKDFQTIPGWIFNPQKDTKPRLISEEEADLYWLRQTLIGDPVDGYKGAYRIGKVKAERILPHPEPIEVMWRKVEETFVTCKQSTEDALVNARLARILRSEDYDDGKVILWCPPVQRQGRTQRQRPDPQGEGTPGDREPDPPVDTDGTDSEGLQRRGSAGTHLS